MKNIFEIFNPSLELQNEIKHYLEQFSFLKYSIYENGDGFTLTFSDDVTYPYIKGLLNSFKINLLSDKPLSIVVFGFKHIDSYKDYKEKKVIGNTEKIDIKELDIYNVDAKVDTGATTSCINASNIKVNGNKVSFSPLKQTKVYTYPILEKVRVQSSNGDTELRPLIKLKIKLGDKEIETFFSLTNRNKMNTHILLGKDVLSSFLIDPTKIK
jgi:hypothetical protein